MKRSDEWLDDPLITEFCHLSELSDKPTFWLDARGRIICANGAFLTSLGYDEVTTAQLSISDFNPEVSLLRWKRWWKTLQGEKRLVEEGHHINADGVIFPVRISLTLHGKDRLFCAGTARPLTTDLLDDHLEELMGRDASVAGFRHDFVQGKFELTRGFADVLQLPEPSDPPASLPDLFQNFDTAEPFSAVELVQRLRQSATSVATSVDLRTRQGQFQTYDLHLEPLRRFDETISYYGTVRPRQKKTVGSGKEDSSAMPGAELDRSRYVMDNAPDLVYWIPADGSLQYFNRAVCEKLEYDPEELRTMHVWDIDPNRSEGADWAQLWQSFRRGDSSTFETVNKTRSGKLLDMQVSVNFLEIGGDEILCCFVRDITDLRRRRKRLDIYRHTVENAQEVILWVDPEGRLRNFNGRAAELLELTEADYEKLPLVDLVPNIQEKGWSHLWETVRRKGSVHRRLEMLTKSGTDVPVDFNPTYLRTEEEELLCIFIRDIRQLLKQEDRISELNKQLTQESAYLQEEISGKHDFNNIVTRSKRYRKVLGQIAQVADTEATVLVLGETGTGKELLARAIHSLSERADRPLIKVNCAALPENLIESELFGHERGAFTGAHARKIGRFELAHEGTIFLDEIGEMPLDLQAKLLRVLQEGEFERLGDPKTYHTDVRVIAATNRDLEKMVADGRFREDLFYRLNVFPIINLPLRQRLDDVPVLVKHFINKYNEKVGRSVSTYSQGAMEKLMQYDFPGNIRELENMVERALILSKGDKLNLEAVLPRPGDKRVASAKKDNAFLPFEEMQRQHIIEALKRCDWQVSGAGGAAELLELNHKTLSSKMRKLGIRKNDFIRV